jgi:uncharacterized protein YndB with AHSA1/START domain
VVDEAVTIAVPISDVWNAIADAEVRGGWWSYVDLDMNVGGRIEERWVDDYGVEILTKGRVLEIAPGRSCVSSGPMRIGPRRPKWSCVLKAARAGHAYVSERRVGL